MLSYFRPPVFAEGKRTEKARLLFVAVWFMSVVVISYGLAIGAMSGFDIRTVLILISVPVGLIITLELNRRGWTDAAGWFNILLYIGILMLRTPAAGGIRSPGIAMFPILALFAGIVMGRRAGLATAAICVGLTLLLVVAEHLHVLTGVFVTYPPLLYWYAATAWMVLAVFWLRVAARRVQGALRTSRLAERKLALALEAGGIGIFETDLAKGEVILDTSARRIWGYPPDRGERFTIDELKARIHPDDLVPLNDSLVDHPDIPADEQKPIHLEIRLLIPDEPVRHVLIRAAFYEDETGGTRKRTGMLVDLTARIGAEEELRLLNERLNLATAGAGIGIWEWQLDTNKVVWDDTMHRLYGVTKESFGGTYQAWADMLYPEDRLGEDARRRAIRVDRGDRISTFRILRPDGETRHMRIISRTFRNQVDRPDRTVGINFDITDSALAEQALRDSERKLNAIFEHSVMGIALTDADGRPVTCNGAFQRILGRYEAELRQSTLREFSHPEDVAVDAELYRQLKSGERDNYLIEKRYVTGKGQTIWCEVAVAGVRGPTGEIEFLVLGLMETTERKRAEAERASLQSRLRSAEQVRAIGTLAGGIAHDFNNLLGAILGFSQLLEEDLPPGSEEHRFANRITDAAERGKAIVGQIMSFSRQGALERAVTDLGDLLGEIGPLLTSLVAPKVTLTITQDHGLNVLINVGQMTQVLANLCKNASDAMEGRDGRIAVDLRRIEPAEVAKLLETVRDGAAIMVGAMAPNATYACVRVADTGIGIAPDKLPHIFELFYTTKDRERGTGLGLAVVPNAVEAYNGACIAESEVGRGTCFSFLMPLAQESEESVPTASKVRPTAGAACIMVVDDESDITEILVTGLKRRGFEAVGFNDPRAALEAFKEDVEAWSALITDQLMPGLRGVELARAAKGMKSDLPAILYSGFDGVSDPADRDLFDLRLVKPMDIDELVRRFAPLLSERAISN